MSNFGDNNLSFPSTTTQIMHLTCGTIESYPKTNYGQRNLTTQVMSFVIRPLMFLDGKLCALELEGLDLIGNSSKGGVDKLATLLP
jgi:hypothetical protein